MKYLKRFNESNGSEYYELLSSGREFDADELAPLDERDKNYFISQAKKLGLVARYFEAEISGEQGYGWDDEAEQDFEIGLWLPENICIYLNDGKSFTIHKAKDGFFFVTCDESGKQWHCDGKRGVIELINDLNTGV